VLNMVDAHNKPTLPLQIVMKPITVSVVLKSMNVIKQTLV